MRTDREKLFLRLDERHGLPAAALRRLEKDLEPIFRIADGPLWPEGTDCGAFASPRARMPKERTQLLPLEIEPACMYARVYRGSASRVGIEHVVERFHEQACEVIGYEKVVELGSILGDALLDPLFRRLGVRGIDAYLNLQFLALYRVAAEVAGLATEAELLGLYIRRFTGEAETWHEVEPEHILEEAPDSREAG